MLGRLKRIKNKKDTTFEVLFDSYAKSLLVYAKKFVLSQEEAEDIVQDIFVKLWEGSGDFTDTSIKSYLIKATKNSCLNYLKHMKVRSEYQNEILSKGDLVGSIDPKFYVGEDLKQHIDKLIDSLPPQQRKTFLMHKFDGKTYAEIAVELGISARTVEKHVELASKRLKKDLGKSLYILLFLFSLEDCFRQL